MQDRQTQGSRTARRLLLLAASFAVGAVVWFMLGDSDSATAAETAVAAESSAPSNPEPAEIVVARVNGEPITEEAVKAAIAGQLAEIERQKQALIARAVDDQVHGHLLDVEAEKRGLSRDALLEAEEARVSDAEVDAYNRTHREPIDEPVARRTIAYQTLIARLESAAEIEILTPALRGEAAAAGSSE